MRTWNGKLFVYQGDDGQQYVTAANPTGRGVAPVRIHAYFVSGPFMPIGWPKAVAVRDAAVWMNELRKQGFACEPCSVE